MPEAQGSLGPWEGFRPLLPGPVPELSETRTMWWQEGWHSGCPLQYTRVSLALIPASFYPSDSLPVAAETRVAAQVPPEPDGTVDVGQVGDNREWWGVW